MDCSTLVDASCPPLTDRSIIGTTATSSAAITTTPTKNHVRLVFIVYSSHVKQMFSVWTFYQSLS